MDEIRPFCPYCLSSLDDACYVYIADGEIIGCENCIKKIPMAMWDYKKGCETNGGKKQE